MKPGETVVNKKRVYFMLFDSTNGEPITGGFSPAAGELQYNRDEAGWNNATLANFAHIWAGLHRYLWANSEIAGATEGVMLLRVNAAAVRPQIVVVPLELIAVDTIATSASSEITDIKAKTDNLPADPADESLVIAATDAIVAKLDILNGLHQRNSVLDGGAGFASVQYNASKELTAARRRVFADEVAAAAATPGAADDVDGEIARYLFVGTGTGTGLTATFRFLTDLEP